MGLLLSISTDWNLDLVLSILAEGLGQPIFIELGIVLSDFFDKILVELNRVAGTRGPMSNRIGGAENAAILDKVVSERMDLLSS